MNNDNGGVAYFIDGAADVGDVLDGIESRRDRWQQAMDTFREVLDLAAEVDCDYGGASVKKATDERAEVALTVEAYVPAIGHDDPLDQLIKHDAALGVRLGLTADDYYRAEVTFGF